MNANLIVIDLSRIEEDIRILERDLSLKKALKEYAIQNAVSKNMPETNGFDTDKEKESKNTLIDNTANNSGISAFIINLIKESGSINTKDIIDKYAEAYNKPYKLVRNNVSNAITRLKKMGKIESTNIPGENGSIHTLKKNRAELALQ